MAGCRLDINNIIAAARIDQRQTSMGGFNHHIIDAFAQTDIQHFHIKVGQTTGEEAASNRRIIRHAQTGDAAVAQHHLFFCRAFVVVDRQGVDLIFFVHAQVQVHRCIAIGAAHAAKVGWQRVVNSDRCAGNGRLERFSDFVDQTIGDAGRRTVRHRGFGNATGNLYRPFFCHARVSDKQGDSFPANSAVGRSCCTTADNRFRIICTGQCKANFKGQRFIVAPDVQRGFTQQVHRCFGCQASGGVDQCRQITQDCAGIQFRIVRRNNERVNLGAVCIAQQVTACITQGDCRGHATGQFTLNPKGDTQPVK